MLKATDFHLAIVQLVLFTPDLSAFSTPKALAVILGKFSHIYDGDVQALPLPEETPPDIPRVRLQSKDEFRRLDIAPLRLVAQWIQPKEKQTELQNIISNSLEVLEHYLQSLDVKVGRLGLRLTRIYQSEDSAQLIIERFCKPELKNTIFKNTQDFDLKNYESIKINELDVNSVMSYRTAVIKINKIESQGIVLEQDLNTLSEEIEQHNFQMEEISNYFQSAAAEAELNLKLHFPEEV